MRNNSKPYLEDDHLCDSPKRKLEAPLRRLCPMQQNTCEMKAECLFWQSRIVVETILLYATAKRLRCKSIVASVTARLRPLFSTTYLTCFLGLTSPCRNNSRSETGKYPEVVSTSPKTRMFLTSGLVLFRIPYRGDCDQRGRSRAARTANYSAFAFGSALQGSHPRILRGFSAPTKGGLNKESALRN